MTDICALVVQLYMNWVSTCDFIIPVAFPDFFNVSSLDGLLHSVLPDMLDARQSYVDYDQQRMLDQMKRSDPAIPIEEFRFSRYILLEYALQIFLCCFCGWPHIY